MCLKKKRLIRKERLRKKSDLTLLFKNAKKIRYKEVTLLYLKTEYTVNRIVIIARKGFKNAVNRNRQKRLVKEVYRHLKPNMKSGYDIVILIIPANYSYKKYLLILQSLFHKALIMK